MRQEEEENNFDRIATAGSSQDTRKQKLSTAWKGTEKREHERQEETFES